MMETICENVENFVGKGGNAGYQDFLLFPKVFSRPVYTWVV